MSIRSIPPLIGDAPWDAEAGLMTEIASGSQTAFAQLYDLTCARVFGFILSVIEARAAAEEVLQDTYLHVWSNARDFAAHRASASASEWITEIARSRALERIRTAGAGATGAVDGLAAPSEAA